MPVYLKARRTGAEVVAAEVAEIEVLTASYAVLMPTYLPAELRCRIAAFAACTRTPVFRRGRVLIVVK